MSSLIVQLSIRILNDIISYLIFEKDNSEDLAVKLESVILSKELRERIGINANKWVIENHSWDVISKRVIDVYQKLTREE